MARPEGTEISFFLPDPCQKLRGYDGYSRNIVDAIVEFLFFFLRTSNLIRP